MIARVIINDIVIEKKVENHSLDGTIEGFVSFIIKQKGIWDEDSKCFYPFHKIDKIEYNEK